jgi:alpha-1,6-mannosyltransferase
LLRNGAVRAALERFVPDLIECQDAYNLPWAAISHRKRHPDTALVACYMTDFPTVYVKRPLTRFVGRQIAGALSRLSYAYAARLYSRFDQVFALSENGGAATLRAHGVASVDVVPLGVELGGFGPERRDQTLRQSLGVAPNQPLLIYVGRLDGEKRAQTVVDAFLRLPPSLGTRLALLGEGPMRDQILALGNARIVAPGYVRDRDELGRWLASSDIYVSGMADETFGISIVEAQASGLPVVGVAAGAMIDRVSPRTGRLGPVDDDAAMAANILEIWDADRTAMASEARTTALGYSWDNTMELLFGRVYPNAFAARSSVERSTAQAKPATLAAGLGKEAV